MLNQNQGVMCLPADDSPAHLAETAVIAALAQARQELARHLLKLPTDDLELLYASSLGAAHRLLLTSGARFSHPTKTDNALIAQAVNGLQSAGSDASILASLLVAMLYLEPHELPLIVPFETVPHWLRDDYGNYMVTPHDLFRYAGEADIFGRHMKRWLGYLRTNIVGRPHDSLWVTIGPSIMESMNLISVYPNELNLRDAYRSRAEIYECVLRSSGYALDYEFPSRGNRPKIRLGILAAHYSPGPETFATLPVYEHIDRSLFEIVLITTQVTNAPLERYCVTRADRFLQLPDDLPSQALAIRNADLDFVLVATNVTAVPNAITLLAAHRLARVQIAMVPSCTTTGMSHFDYYLSGRLSEPAEGAQAHYTERLLLVDGPAHCYNFATEQISATTQMLTREMFGIPADAPVFISGANFHKVIPEVQDVWLRVLEKTPGSYLLLYPFNLNWSNTYPVEAFLQRFRTAAAACGISDERLIVFAPAPSRATVSQWLRLADVYLDSFPFSGATSLLDPLEVGLPCVVMNGHTFRALVGPALLRTIDMDQLIAVDAQSFVDIAHRLATDTALRADVGAKILAAMSARPKFLDPHWYASQVSEILRAIWIERSAANFAPLPRLN